MKSNYDVETYAEAFDRHNDFTGAIHPEGLAAEFRGICEDADKEIASHATEVARLGEANDAQGKLLKEAVATSRAQAENFVKMKRRAETAEAERDAAVAAKEQAEADLAGERQHSALMELNEQAAVARAKRAEEALRGLVAILSIPIPVDTTLWWSTLNDHVVKARAAIAAAQDAKPDHIADASKMVSDEPADPYRGELGRINLRLLARKMLWVLRYLKRQSVYHPAMDDLICEGIMHGLESDGPTQDLVPVPTERERRWGGRWI